MRKGESQCLDEKLLSCCSVFKKAENTENILDQTSYLDSFLFTSLVLSVTANNSIGSSDDEETCICNVATCCI